MKWPFFIMLAACCGCSVDVGDKVVPFFSRNHALEPGDSVSFDSSFRQDEVSALTTAVEGDGLVVTDDGSWHVLRGRAPFGDEGPNDHAAWAAQTATMWIDGNALSPNQERDLLSGMIDSIEAKNY